MFVLGCPAGVYTLSARARVQKTFDGTKQLLYSAWFDKDGKFPFEDFVSLLLVLACMLHFIVLLSHGFFLEFSLSLDGGLCLLHVKGNSIGNTEGGFPDKLGTWETISVSVDTGSAVPAAVRLYVGHPLESTAGHVEVRQVPVACQSYSHCSGSATLCLLFWLAQIEWLLLFQTKSVSV